MIKYALLTIGLILGIFAGPRAWGQVLTEELQLSLMAADNVPVPVIVTFRDQVDLEAFRQSQPRRLSVEGRRGERGRLVRMLRERAVTSQHGVRNLLKTRGVERVRDLWHVNRLAFSATPKLIEELAARPEVASIQRDEVVQLPPVVPLADTNGNAIEDNLELIGTPALWNLGLTGQGVTVAIVDSGVDLNHPELASRWRGGVNSWFNAIATNCGTSGVICATVCDFNTSLPCDSDDGHGTAVAGVAVAGSASGSAIGVAPGAQWIAAKIFDSAGGGVSSIISEAFAWLLDPDRNPLTDDAPDVINASWGFNPGQCQDVIADDVRALKAAGIAVVFAAGNDGPEPNTSISPANTPSGFGVGSVGTFVSATEISPFSGRGPSACDNSIYPDLVAPGFSIKTTGLNGSYLEGINAVTGTSFSAPHVVGTIALLLSHDGTDVEFPTLPVSVLEQVLVNSATDLGEFGPDNDYGNGLVNAQRAYTLLLPPIPSLVAPADLSIGLPTSLTLVWSQPFHPFGAPVTNSLVIATDPIFNEAVVLELNPSQHSVEPMLLGAFGLAGLLMPVILMTRKGKKSWLLCGVLLAVFTLLASCGGGGGGGASEQRSEIVSGLNPATTYFWKVQARTTQGALSESQTFSFTTQ